MKTSFAPLLRYILARLLGCGVPRIETKYIFQNYLIPNLMEYKMNFNYYLSNNLKTKHTQETNLQLIRLPKNELNQPKDESCK